MNYYPYMMNMPLAYQTVKPSLFSNLFKGFNFSSILSGTGKVLNVANQAIPLIKQVKPVINNAKTMFNVMNEFRKVDNISTNTQTIKNSNSNNNINNISNKTNNSNNNINNISNKTNNSNIDSNMNTKKKQFFTNIFSIKKYHPVADID